MNRRFLHLVIVSAWGLSLGACTASDSRSAAQDTADADPKSFASLCEKAPSSEARLAAELLKDRLQTRSCLELHTRLQAATQLDLADLGLRDIGLLSYASNAASIDLQNNALTDLDPLAQLKNLKDLNLENNRSLKDLASLKLLPQLESLNIKGTEITNFSFLSNLSELRELRFTASSFDGGQALSKKIRVLDFTHPLLADPNFVDLPIDYSWLRPLAPTLESLEIADYQVTNISFLAELHQVQKLVLFTGVLSNPEVVSDLKNLKELHLLGNLNGNVDFLKHATQLEKLVLPANGIESVSALSGLTNLKQLDLSGNPLSEMRDQR